VAPGRIGVERLSLGAFDSRISAIGALSAVNRGTRIEAEAHLTDGKLDTLRRAFGFRELPVAGQIEAHILASAEGRRLNEAVLGGDFTAVLAMDGGDIARKTIEIASLDPRALFRTARGTTPLTCLLGVVDIRAGQGNASPLRIRADTGTVSGLAHFDLKTKYLDLIIGSHRETTSFFALDVPVRLRGRFDDPNIAPARWSRDGRAQIANAKANVPALPPELRDFALRSPCYWGNRQ
jgi:AsmA family protein